MNELKVFRIIDFDIILEPESMFREKDNEDKERAIWFLRARNENEVSERGNANLARWKVE